MEENPKLFMSYSWTSPGHEKWVLTLAEELVSQGVNVIIDKWNLKHGHDANAFMESMVTDPSVNKVLIVCDARYVEKSNARTGGAGTEAQIITPQLYAKSEQEKFVAVVREKKDDGTPYLPVYYLGRIFFDLSDEAKYAEEFEGIVRWAWGAPAYVKPELGKKPSFLSELSLSTKMSTTVSFRRAYDAIRSDRKYAEASISEYFNLFSSELEKFRIEEGAGEGKFFDDLVVENLDSFIHYRNEVIEIFLLIAMYRPLESSVRLIHRFFESLEPYTRRPEHFSSFGQNDYDNFKFIVHELFLYVIAIFIKHEKFDLASYLINNEYFTNEDSKNPMKTFEVFSNYMGAIKGRSMRLNRLSSHADLLKSRCGAVGVDFRYIMVADFVLYLNTCGKERSSMWWPETLIFSSYHYRAPVMEIFARAKSKSYFKKIAPMLGVENVDDLKARISALDSRKIPRWQFESIDPVALMRLNELCTAP